MAASKKLNQNLYALITGVTRSIGNELAKLLSRNDYQLILVAKDADQLQRATRHLEGMGGVEITPLNGHEAAKQLLDLDTESGTNRRENRNVNKSNNFFRITPKELKKAGVDENYLQHDYRDHYYDFQE